MDGVQLPQGYLISDGFGQGFLGMSKHVPISSPKTFFASVVLKIP